jgi:hypothetical protein
LNLLSWLNDFNIRHQWILLLSLPKKFSGTLWFNLIVEWFHQLCDFEFTFNTVYHQKLFLIQTFHQFNYHIFLFTVNMACESLWFQVTMESSILKQINMLLVLTYRISVSYVSFIGFNSGLQMGIHFAFGACVVENNWLTTKGWMVVCKKLGHFFNDF